MNQLGLVVCEDVVGLLVTYLAAGELAFDSPQILCFWFVPWI
jgi:hypothetical protein